MKKVAVTPNVALKMALFETGVTQERVAELAGIAPQDLSHAITRKRHRELDEDEQRRLIRALKRFGVRRTVEELFAAQVEQRA